MDSFLRDRLSLLAAIGCGIAFGVSGVYTYYVTNKQINHQINGLTQTIEELKKEVKDLRIASVAASVAVSQTHSPILSNHFQFNAENNELINRLNCSGVDYEDNRCQMDGQLTAPPIDNSVSTDDNEEFFDFTEGETENETNLSMECQNRVDSLSDTLSDTLLASNHKNDISLEEWLKRYDSLLDDTSVNKKELYEQIIGIQPKYDNCAQIFWRSAKATHLYGIAAQKDSDIELKKKLAFETLDYAKKAIQYDDNNPECHKWYAIAIGSLSDYITTKEKIANGHEFKKHVDLALKLKPNDPSLHHMLGRFCYEISNLTWVERKIASALFSKVPESSFDDSLNHLLKAFKLRNEWKENILFISKILIHLKKYSEAIEWIDRGLAIDVVGEDDAIAHQQLVLLNSKNRKYR